jgi:hypothetical protein
MPELESERELAAEVSAGVSQCRKCLILLAFIAAGDDLYSSMAGIGADMDFGHVHVYKPGIVQLKSNDLAELFADRFAYP